MKIALCDDDALCREQLLAVMENYIRAHAQKDIILHTFSHGEDLLEAADKNGGYDIYLLDIVMPGINGIKLGVTLREHGCDGKIIYLTTSEEYAIASFRARPFDYILKPISNERLFAALDEAAASLTLREEKFVTVKTRERSLKLNFDSIVYAQLNRRTIWYHLTNGAVVESVHIRTTFSEAVQSLLKDDSFVLCGAGLVVNMNHITGVESDALIFRDAETVYLGKKACREIRSVWYDHCFDKEGRQ